MFPVLHQIKNKKSRKCLAVKHFILREINVVVMPARCYKANVFIDVKMLVLLRLFYCSNHYFREAEVFVTTTRITVMLYVYLCLNLGKFSFILRKLNAQITCMSCIRQFKIRLIPWSKSVSLSATNFPFFKHFLSSIAKWIPYVMNLM